MIMFMSLTDKTSEAKFEPREAERSQRGEAVPIEGQGQGEGRKRRQYDLVALVGVVGLIVAACWALYFGHTEVAAGAVGGVAGVLTRLYQ